MKEQNAEKSKAKEPKVTRGGYEIAEWAPELKPGVAKMHIERRFPDFAVASIELLGAGLSSTVYNVNGTHAFRFAMHRKASKTLEKEARLLPKLYGYLSTTIPHPEFVGEGPEHHLFVGYPLVKGEDLFPELLPHTDQGLIARDIAEFLRELHGFNRVLAEKYGVEQMGAAFFEGELLDAREYAFPVFDSRCRPAEAQALKAGVEKAFAAYLGDRENFAFTPSLIHGDLEPCHIIVDPQTKRMSGVVDFGGARLGDTAYDFWYLYARLGREFAGRVIDAYGWRDDRALLYRKLEFFWTAQTLHRLVRSILWKEEDYIGYNIGRLHERFAEAAS